MALLKALRKRISKPVPTKDREPAAQKSPPKKMAIKKFEPEEFSMLARRRTCAACGLNTVAFKSDYPSTVTPFSAQEVLYCTNCGTGQVPNSEELLAGYYEKDYASSNRKDREIEPTTYFSEEFREKSPALQRYFNRAQRQISLLRDHGSPVTAMLDYGSGPGYCLYLSGAEKKFAFEPDEKSTKYLNHIEAQRFSALGEIPANSFDAIVASHSIEHLIPEALLATLAILINSLTKNGILVIEVPHGGHSYLHLDTRQDPHTLFFTPQGLSQAVKLAGGEPLLEKAFAKVHIKRRAHTFYTPPEVPFFQEDRGSLTIVCRRRAD